MKKLIESKNIGAFIVPAVAFACFALLPRAQAVSPPPDGGYPNWNTAEGTNALFQLTTGIYNTALGGQALYRNSTGGYNTAVGLNALYLNTTGYYNTAQGFEALFNNIYGQQNTATGINALHQNQTGSYNTAVGTNALFSNKASNNTAIGDNALFHNITGGANTAIGENALLSNTGGDFNTAIGLNALNINTAGSNNIALGFSAGSNITGGYNIDIGSTGGGGESGTIRIGQSGSQVRVFIAGISGVGVTGTPVVVDGNGQLGVGPSSQRFKDEIKPMDKASEAILALKPVTFRYKHELDPEGMLQFGLVAEEVEKVNPDLVACDAKGEVYTVRYEAVNAMLLNEFLKEHGKVEKLQAAMVQQQKQIEALAQGLQKVSAQLEASKPAPQTVLNNQ
jgi:Chaperone of endosialidase